MHLSDSALSQVDLGACNIVTGRQVRDNLLANPAAVEHTGLGERKAPFQVWYKTNVGGGLAVDIAWVLEIKLGVGTT